MTCECHSAKPAVAEPAVASAVMAMGGDPWPQPIPWRGQLGKVTAIDAVVRADEAVPEVVASVLRQPSPNVVTSRETSVAPKTGVLSASKSAGISATTGGGVEATSVAAFTRLFQKKSTKRPGSGKPARPIIRALVWLRRASQFIFIALFLWLLAATAFRGTFSARASEPVRLPWPVEVFLLADPYVAAMTLLSTHTLYRGLAIAGIVMVLTLVFGRVFCGWICPFGTLHHFFGWIFPSRYLRGNKRVNSNKTHTWQITKYYLLLAFLGAALFGSAIGGLLDPICISVRAIGLGVIPILQYIGIRTTDIVATTRVHAIQSASDSIQEQLARHVWTSNQVYYHQTWLIVFSLIAILFMNRIIPRFWCRALCPLGAFLGIFSRFALFGMKKDHAKCTDCNLCLVHCQAADSPQGGVKHRQEECHVCLNCESACPEDVIKWGFLPNRKSTAQTPNWQRRTMVASAAAGAIALPGMRIANWPDKAYSEKVIRPPGSVEERDFLNRCIRCSECMKVCPNNALHPAFFEAGIEGLWTPILIPRIGYCEFSCVLCGQVCPTGAIQKITEKEKLGIGQKPISIGTAMYDQGRCLPWAMATPCIVCEEFCPTSPKAIWVEEVTVPKRDDRYQGKGEQLAMTTVKLQRPHVDPSLCIGCGACEKACPIVDKPAVYVTNAGESRSRTNVILLENTSYSRSS